MTVVCGVPWVAHSSRPCASVKAEKNSVGGVTA